MSFITQTWRTAERKYDPLQQERMNGILDQILHLSCKSTISFIGCLRASSLTRSTVYSGNQDQANLL
jgi:hypothetical protein